MSGSPDPSEVPDCCECRLERYELHFSFFVTSQAITGDDLVVPAGQAGKPHGDTQWFRGQPVGDFGTRPIKAVIHTDWCKHRPTKAVVWVYSSLPGTNGTVRVFVEGERNFSHNVWAEIEYEAAIPFPALDDRWHTTDEVKSIGGAYQSPGLGATIFRGPYFGVQAQSRVYQPRDKQDPETYLTSPWPMWRPTEREIASNVFYNSPQGWPVFVWQGTLCRVRWGYRQNNSDTVLGSVAFIENHSPLLGSPGNIIDKLSVGCHWADIAEPNNKSDVRCGVELLARPDSVNFFVHPRSFTIPFELPRSLFVDANAGSSIKPFMPYRLVGVEATAPTITVPVSATGTAADGQFITGNSTKLDALLFESFVTCGARRANVLIPGSLQTESGTLPAGPHGGPADPPNDGKIDLNMPVFIRRPDLVERSDYHVANADSWHATHLVRAGSPLAGRNKRHNLNITIEECNFPAGNRRVTPGGITRDSDGSLRHTDRFVTPSPMRAWLNWQGGSAENSPRFRVDFAEDHSFTTGGLPPAWVWDAISGENTLTPFGPPPAGGGQAERLVPNAFHKFSSQPTKQVLHSIETPSSADIDRPWDIGPMTDEQHDEYEEQEYPNRLDDYRAAFGLKSYAQLWATTQINDTFQRLGPLDIPLEDSGMTTENYDKFNPYSVDNLPEAASATITLRGRVGLRIAVTAVKGFRRKRVKVPTDLGALTYKIPFGKCVRDDPNFPGGEVQICEYQMDKSACENTLGGTWTKGVDCQGNALNEFQEVAKVVTEAAALAEFEAAEADLDAYDYAWEQGEDLNGNDIPTLFRPNGSVTVNGDHTSNDVACDEYLFEFNIELTGADVQQISAGNEVVKQLVAGQNNLAQDDGGLDLVDVLRTVRVSVSQA